MGKMMEGIVAGKGDNKKDEEQDDPEKPCEAETLIRTASTRKNDATRSINGPKRGLAKRHVRMELFSEAKTRWTLEHNQLSCQVCCRSTTPQADPKLHRTRDSMKDMQVSTPRDSVEMI